VFTNRMDVRYFDVCIFLLLKVTFTCSLIKLIGMRKEEKRITKLDR
jgi:hypothetical protein